MEAVAIFDVVFGSGECESDGFGVGIGGRSVGRSGGRLVRGVECRW